MQTNYSIGKRTRQGALLWAADDRACPEQAMNIITCTIIHKANPGYIFEEKNIQNHNIFHVKYVWKIHRNVQDIGFAVQNGHRYVT